MMVDREEIECVVKPPPIYKPIFLGVVESALTKCPFPRSANQKAEGEIE